MASNWGIQSHLFVEKELGCRENEDKQQDIHSYTHTHQHINTIKTYYKRNRNDMKAIRCLDAKRVQIQWKYNTNLTISSMFEVEQTSWKEWKKKTHIQSRLTYPIYSLVFLLKFYLCIVWKSLWKIENIIMMTAEMIPEWFGLFFSSNYKKKRLPFIRTYDQNTGSGFSYQRFNILNYF